MCAGVLADMGVQAAGELGRHGVGATVVDPRWLLPINTALLHLPARHRLVITVEDGIRKGGFGTALAMECADGSVATPVRALGLATGFLAAGRRAEILTRQGLTSANIVDTALRALPARSAPAATQVPGHDRRL